MSRAPTSAPEQRFGYHGDETPPDGTGPAPTIGGADAATNRGTPAPREGSGGVVGSGASAGGGGGAEDFDSDAVGGGGSFPEFPANAPDEGGDASNHGSR